MDNELENEYFEDTAQDRDGMSYRPEGDENGLLQEFRYTLDQTTLTEGLTFAGAEDEEEDEDPTYVPPSAPPVQAAPEPAAPSPQPQAPEARTPDEPPTKQSFFQRLFGN